MSHPSAEVEVDERLIRQLLAEQCPELADLALKRSDEGWDNFTFRLGTEYAVRLPRREVAVSLLMHEQRWLSELAARLPIEVPTPVYCGFPSRLFGWPWSVVHWVEGETAESYLFSVVDAKLLAETLRALHRPAPAEAPPNPYRGVPLATRSGVFRERLVRLSEQVEIDPSHFAAIFDAGCAAVPSPERVWLHGDLHPRNVIVRDNALVGLIDWGDLTAGDPASDLACAWLVINGAAIRNAFFQEYKADEALISRAKGWAVHLGLALLASGESRHAPMGLAALQRVSCRE